MKNKPVYIVLLYLVASITWILVSDYLVEFFRFITGFSSNTLQTSKGIFFVSATTVLLHFMIKKQQKVLVNYGNQYKNLFYSNPNPLWIYDRKTFKFLEANDAATRIYGYSREEFKKMTILDIRPEEDRQAVIDSVNAMPDYYHVSGVFRHLKKNGELITVSITSNKIKFNKKECAMVMANDITVRLQQEERLKLSYNIEKELKENLERNLELLTQSLAETKKREDQIIEQNRVLRRHSWTNSHAIRRPLASILSLVSLCRDTVHLDEMKELHSLIEHSSKELDDIIRRIGKEINNYERENETGDNRLES